MRIKTAIIAATVVSAVGAAPAGAAMPDSWYLTKRQAQRHTAQVVEDKYGLIDRSAFCRPYGRRAPERGYAYHRWVCTWGVIVEEQNEYDCPDGEEWLMGRVSIGGSRYRGNFSWKVINGMSCDFAT